MSLGSLAVAEGSQESPVMSLALDDTPRGHRDFVSPSVLSPGCNTLQTFRGRWTRWENLAKSFLGAWWGGKSCLILSLPALGHWQRTRGIWQEKPRHPGCLFLFSSQFFVQIFQCTTVTFCLFSWYSCSMKSAPQTQLKFKSIYHQQLNWGWKLLAAVPDQC